MVRKILGLMLVGCVACGGVDKPAVQPQPGAVGEPPSPAPGPEQAPMIRVSVPTADAVVSSPLVVTGEARGTWFFEASFPVTLLDAEGKPVARGYAQAQGEWMTEQFVPFKAELTFAAAGAATGVLVLEKANASGEPEHAAEVRVPVRFASP